MSGAPHDVPSQVTSGRGVVCAKGPDDVEIDFTPEAAGETAIRLTEAAVKAKGEQTCRPD